MGQSKKGKRTMRKKWGREGEEEIVEREKEREKER